MMHRPLSRREFIRLSVLTAGVLAGSTLVSCGPASAPAASMRITSPPANAALAGPKVKIEVEVTGLSLVDANIAPKDGEGHLHFFIDTPASAVPAGQVIPTDQPTKFVHAGKAPYTNREIELTKGQHTITVVPANAAHVVLATPAPVSVTFLVT